MIRRREQHVIVEPRDELIRVNRRTYALVEVNKDRNGRTLYTPILPNGKLEISFSEETRSPCGSDSEDQNAKPVEEELIEVELSNFSLSSKTDNDPDAKVNVDIEIIKPNAMFKNVESTGKSYQLFKSCLTKAELIKLITDEVKIEGDQMINLINVMNQSSLAEAQEEQPTTEVSEKKMEEIRSELKHLCIEIESKGLAECKQTDITSQKIEMTDNKPIRHRVRPVPYHCREEFHQIIKDQLAAGIIRTKE